MYRGTTPTIIYNVNSELDLDSMEQVWATFKSKSKEITKELDEIEIDNEAKTVTVRLTQEETLQLKDSDVLTQLRFLTVDGKAYASNQTRLKVNDILKGGVIYGRG